jgi:hypothetical protein
MTIEGIALALGFEAAGAILRASLPSPRAAIDALVVIALDLQLRAIVDDDIAWRHRSRRPCWTTS